MEPLRRLEDADPLDPVGLQEHISVELIIARARAVVALAVLVVWSLDPLEHTGSDVVSIIIFAAYALYAAVVAVAMHSRRQAAARLGLALHGGDLFWAWVVTSLSGGPSSHFSPPLFVFGTLASAYRWGYRETILTGIAGAALLIFEGVAAGYGLLGVPLRVGDLVWRTVWLLLVAFILGYLAERDKRLRAQSLLLARIGRNVRVQSGLTASIHSVLEELRQAFSAGHALLASEESSTGRVYQWATHRGCAADNDAWRPGEVATDRRETYIFPIPGEVEAFEATRQRTAGRRDTVSIRAIGPDRRRVTRSIHVPDRIAGDLPWQSLMCVSMNAFEGWDVRVLLVDPAVGAGDDHQLRFLQTLVRQAGPAVANVYLVRRLRSKVEEVERARVARELHDGVIQALIGLEMQVDVARRETGLAPARAAATLEHVQQVLRDQVVDVRHVMTHLRPIRADRRTLVGVIADHVGTFARITGIDASFSCAVENVDLPPRVCRELARIVEEALVNVRKHSGAPAVTVSLSANAGAYELTVGDNGRGYLFAGRLSLAELDARRLGPAIIKERVREIGGHLWIQSAPGNGSQLNISVQTLAQG